MKIHPDSIEVGDVIKFCYFYEDHLCTTKGKVLSIQTTELTSKAFIIQRGDETKPEFLRVTERSMRDIISLDRPPTIENLCDIMEQINET